MTVSFPLLVPLKPAPSPHCCGPKFAPAVKLQVPLGGTGPHGARAVMLHPTRAATIRCRTLPKHCAS